MTMPIITTGVSKLSTQRFTRSAGRTLWPTISTRCGRSAAGLGGSAWRCAWSISRSTLLTTREYWSSRPGWRIMSPKLRSLRLMVCS